MLDKLPEGVKLNPDGEIVARLQEALKRTGGYCPCRVMRTPENLCICREFKEQIADPAFKGFCHCKLYFKE